MTHCNIVLNICKEKHCSDLSIDYAPDLWDPYCLKKLRQYNEIKGKNHKKLILALKPWNSVGKKRQYNEIKGKNH